MRVALPLRSRPEKVALQDREIAKVHGRIVIQVRERSPFGIDGNRNSPRACGCARSRQRPITRIRVDRRLPILALSFEGSDHQHQQRNPLWSPCVRVGRLVNVDKVVQVHLLRVLQGNLKMSRQRFVIRVFGASLVIISYGSKALHAQFIERPTFRGMGGGSQYGGGANAVSGDGRVAVGCVGQANTPNRRATRFEDGLLTQLTGAPTGFILAEAFGVSHNGSVILGVGIPTGGDTEAFRWENGVVTRMALPCGDGLLWT